MSMFGNITMLSAAMRQFQYGAMVAANNIANINTPGYSRQVLALSPVTGIRSGNLILGQGVNALYVQRIRDMFLDNQMHFELGELGRANAREGVLSSLTALLPDSPTAGVAGAVTALDKAWTDLAAGTATKGQVLSALQNVAQNFNVAARELNELGDILDSKIKGSVDEVNSLLERVAELNRLIMAGRTVAQLPNELLDMRELAAQRLAELVGARSTVNANNTMVVTFAGGTLVNGRSVYRLGTMPSPTDPGRDNVTYTTSNGRVMDATKLLRTGELGGLLLSRDIDVEQTLLNLDKAAFGLIQRSNEINRSFVAADTTFGHDLFSGSKASDIQVVQAVITDPTYIGDTRGLAMDLATLQAGLDGLGMYAQIQSDAALVVGIADIDHAAPLSAEVADFTTAPVAGDLVIVAGGNATTITYDLTMSLNDIVANINAAGGGAFYATLEKVAGVFNQTVFHLYSTQPVSVYDAGGGNLGQALNLSATLSSTAPVNNFPIAKLVGADGTLPMNTAPNLMGLYTTADAGLTGTGSVTVDGVTVNWVEGDTVDTVVAAMSAAGVALTAVFDPNTQIVSFKRAGAALLTQAAPLTSISITDTVGNLADVLNINPSSNTSDILENLVTALAAKKDNEEVNVAAAQALVNNTAVLQGRGSQVDAATETQILTSYKLAHDAAVRMQYVIDAMMDKLINGMASPDASR